MKGNFNGFDRGDELLITSVEYNIKKQKNIKSIIKQKQH